MSFISKSLQINILSSHKTIHTTQVGKPIRLINSFPTEFDYGNYLVVKKLDNNSFIVKHKFYVDKFIEKQDKTDNDVLLYFGELERVLKKDDRSTRYLIETFTPTEPGEYTTYFIKKNRDAPSVGEKVEVKDIVYNGIIKVNSSSANVYNGCL